MKTWVDKIMRKFELTPFSPSRDLPAVREMFQGHHFLDLYTKLGGPEINEHRVLYFHHLSPFCTHCDLERSCGQAKSLEGNGVLCLLQVA